MPPHRATSPLSLEICSLPPAHSDSDDIIGSDDELDNEGRASQHRRIEKLANAYLQGKPLFIFSASLRGPFDQDWVNPWRKNRRHNDTTEQDSRRMHKGEDSAESPVIQETNLRKRTCFLQSQIPHHAKSSSARPNSDTAVSSRIKKCSSEEAALFSNPSTRQDARNKMSISLSQVSSSRAKKQTTRSKLQSKHAAHVKDVDRGWLRKDRDHVGFQDIDPPTSPTTKTSSRCCGAKNLVVKHTLVQGQPRTVRTEQSERMYNDQQNQPTSQTSAVTATRVGDDLVANVESFPPGSKRPISHTGQLPISSTSSSQERSFHFLSSSSHLPGFGYRRKKRCSTSPKTNKDPPITTYMENQEGPSHSASSKGFGILHQPNPVRQQNLPMDSTRQNQVQPEQNPQDSVTLTSASNTLENDPASHSERVQSVNNQSKEATSDKLPSAQQVRQNPTVSDYLTSLHSIAITKVNSEAEDDTIADQELSTQAALLLAQQSFQNDLDSYHRDSKTPERKRRASQLSNCTSPTASNIIPFYRLSTPNDHRGNDQPRPNGMVDAHMMSTKVMIDAMTPFTFSTEKKENHGLIFSPTGMSSSKKPKSCSFVGSSTPSPENNETRSEPGTERNPDSVIHSQPFHISTQHSALPMTLTGTTPPTDQDAQGGFPGAESFNLNQAIAEAGSWLQQSFDINKDIDQCRNYRSGPPSTGDRQQARVGVDTIS